MTITSSSEINKQQKFLPKQASKLLFALRQHIEIKLIIQEANDYTALPPAFPCCVVSFFFFAKWLLPARYITNFNWLTIPPLHHLPQPSAVINSIKCSAKGYLERMETGIKMVAKTRITLSQYPSLFLSSLLFSLLFAFLSSMVTLLQVNV